MRRADERVCDKVTSCCFCGDVLPTKISGDGEVDETKNELNPALIPRGPRAARAAANHVLVFLPRAVGAGRQELLDGEGACSFFTVGFGINKSCKKADLYCDKGRASARNPLTISHEPPELHLRDLQTLQSIWLPTSNLPASLPTSYTSTRALTN